MKSGRVLHLGLMALVVLAAIEALFRYVLFPEYRTLQQTVFARHPVLEHYNRPNLELRRYSPGNFDVVNRTNGLGLRGRAEWQERELQGVWVGGDSNVYAAGVEDTQTFVYRLREHGIWAANLASEGHTLPLQALLVRFLAEKGYRPRAVVIGLTMPHAIQNQEGTEDIFTRPLTPEAEPSHAAATARSELVAGVSALSGVIPRDLVGLRGKLVKSSAAYGWLKEGMMGVPFLRDWTLKAGLRADLDLVYKGSLDLLRPFVPENPAWKQVRSTVAFAKVFQSWVKENLGVPFGIVLVPSYHQMYPDRFARFVGHAGLAGQDLDPRRMLDAMDGELQAAGVPVLDLLPGLKASGVDPLTFPDDGHLNARANEAAAAFLADWLKADLGVAPKP